MNCCGQKRQQWQQQTQVQTAPVDTTPVLQDAVPVTYIGSSSFIVKGEATGFIYLFGEEERQLNVDGRDVQQLLKQPTRFSLV